MKYHAQVVQALLCIGDLMYEGRAGNKLRMEWTYEDNKIWIHYEVQK